LHDLPRSTAIAREENAPPARRRSGMLREDRYKKLQSTMRELRCALSIAGLDPSGGAGLFADLRAFREASVWGCGAVAVMTVQSTAGLRASTPIATADVVAQVRELFAHQNIRAVKLGALGSLSNVRGVTRLLDELAARIPVVIDPVVRATRGASRAPLLEKRAIASLLEMVPRATLITPNAVEAALFTGHPVRTVEDAERAAKTLVGRGARAALVKGGHLVPAKGDVIDVLVVGARVFHLRSQRARISPHGTGCTLASLVAGRLAASAQVDDAAIVASVRWAKRRLAARFDRAVRAGHGQWVLP
jgi:hydroxymethylpyrimidine kinase/phosphomethylpyrimidine kinase